MVLTPDEMRIEIAKLKGWKLYKMDFSQIPDSFYTWRNVLKLPGRSAPTCDDERCIITELDLSADAAMLKSMAPNWPEDIAAAWELVEEAQAEPHECFFSIAHTPAIPHKGKPCWHVELGGIFEYGETAPLAICAAYIAWRNQSPHASK